jgi:hypothetical protein
MLFPADSLTLEKATKTVAEMHCLLYYTLRTWRNLPQQSNTEPMQSKQDYKHRTSGEPGKFLHSALDITLACINRYITCDMYDRDLRSCALR